MKIVAIGNAIVDILSQIDDEILNKKNLSKGSMSLIEADVAGDLLQIKSTKIDCGGSAANTIAAISQLGVDSGFIGKVCNDKLGLEFIRKIRKTNTKFLSNNYHDNPTARSFILVSPDAQRTMCTYLGCASNIDDDDIEEKYFIDTKILYLEGYLWDKAETICALKKAIRFAKKHYVQIAFSASDSFCVERHKADFLKLIANDLEILFANEDEFLSLSDNKQYSDEAALKFFNQYPNLTAIITRSEKGCVIIKDGKLISEPAKPAPNLLDSTGAGDAFAAGFLFKLLNNETIESAAQFGNLLAAKIIQKFGARFEDDEIKQLGSVEI